jgi:hypothetical protein
MAGDLSEDGDEVVGRGFGGGVVELWRELDSELPGVLDEAVSHAPAEAAERVAEGVFVEVPGRDGEGGDGRPGLRVARGVEGEEVVEGARGGVTAA